MNYFNEKIRNEPEWTKTFFKTINREISINWHVSMLYEWTMVQVVNLKAWANSGLSTIQLIHQYTLILRSLIVGYIGNQQSLLIYDENLPADKNRAEIRSSWICLFLAWFVCLHLIQWLVSDSSVQFQSRSA